MRVLLQMDRPGGDSGEMLGGNPWASPAGVAAWKSAAADPVFNACQDSVVDAVYYGLGMQHAAEKKLTTALTKAALWDAQIMHGEADKKFGVPVIMAMADTAAGPLSDPPTPADESKWLGSFLTPRAQIMNTRAEWRPNIYRVATYQKLRPARNWTLASCLQTGHVF